MKEYYLANQFYEEGKRGNGASSGVFQNIDLLSNDLNYEVILIVKLIRLLSMVSSSLLSQNHPFQTANAK